MVFMLFSTGLLFAQKPPADAPLHQVQLSALQAVDMAKKGNRSLAALEHLLTGADCDVKSATTALLPHASLTGNYTRKSGNDMLSVFANTALKNSYSVGFEAQQPLFTGFATINGLKSAQLSRTLQRTSNEKTEQVITYAVLQIYWGLVNLEKSRSVAGDAVQQLDELVANQAALLDQGMATEHDYLLTKASLVQAQMNELNAGKMLRSMKRQFAVLLGLPVNSDIFLTDTVVHRTAILPVNQDSLVASTLSERPDLKEADLKLQLSGLAVTMTRSAYYPSIVAGFSYTTSRPDFSKFMRYQQERWGDDWYGYAALNFNLFDWGNRFFKVKKAKEQYCALLLVNEENRATVEREVRDAHEAVGQEKQALEAAELLAEAREKAYDASYAKHEEGVLPMYELLNAHSNFIAAKYQALQAATTLELALVNLQIGGLGTAGN